VTQNDDLHPLAFEPPGGCKRVQVEPNETPKASVIRLEYSPDMLSCRAEGSSPFLNADTVGSESSSAMQGSSLFKVAGMKRPPTKQ
jgi:hypothetical protein